MANLSSAIAPQTIEPAIHRARLERLTVYEISESELESLERGSPTPLFLNLFITCATTTVTTVSTLLTAELGPRAFTVFVVFATVGGLGALTFGLLWATIRNPTKTTAKAIRDRLPAAGTANPTTLVLDSKLFQAYIDAHDVGHNTVPHGG